MSKLNHYFIRMIVFIGGVMALAFLLQRPLMKAFAHSQALNALIIAVLVTGVLVSFRNIFLLLKERKWLDFFENGTEKFPGRNAPKILAPMAILLEDHNGRSRLPTLTVKSLLSSIEARLDDMREVSRYMIGLLIFLGLLGTFWGLLQTISSIAGVVGSMEMKANNMGDAFQALKAGLQTPLTGMGTSFSSSLFGLAGSLILGFMDLQVGQAASGFYHTLEEKFMRITRKQGDMESLQGNGQAYAAGLLEYVGENMERLQDLMRHHEDNRASVIKSVQIVSEKLKSLADQMAGHQDLVSKVAQNQIELQKSLSHLPEAILKVAGQAGDEQTRHHLRNLDMTSTRLLEEFIEGRAADMAALKDEIRLVSKTISALAQGEDMPRYN